MTWYQFEIFSPCVVASGAERSLGLDIVASRDSIPLAPQDDELARFCTEACGVDASVKAWRLREFASPYYGFDPYAEDWGERVGRVWRLDAALDTPMPDRIVPAREYPRTFGLPESIGVGTTLTPLTDLPVLAIGDSPDREACLAAAAELPEDTGVEVLTYDVYSQLRVDVSTWRMPALDALDEFIEACDPHGVTMTWRDMFRMF